MGVSMIFTTFLLLDIDLLWPISSKWELISLSVNRRKMKFVLLMPQTATYRDASPDPLVTISAEGLITDVNAATENVTGYSRHELIGTDFSNYFTDHDKAKEGYEQVFREGLSETTELILHSSGYVTPVLYNASVYRNNLEWC